MTLDMSEVMKYKNHDVTMIGIRSLNLYWLQQLTEKLRQTSCPIVWQLRFPLFFCASNGYVTKYYIVYLASKLLAFKTTITVIMCQNYIVCARLVSTLLQSLNLYALLLGISLVYKFSGGKTMACNVTNIIRNIHGVAHYADVYQKTYQAMSVLACC